MFSTNNHISGRQLNRLIVIDFLGIIGLIMPQTAVYLSGQDGLIAIFYATLISLFYTFIILLLKQKIKDNLIDYLRKKAGRVISVIVGLVFAIKYFVLAVIVLCILGNIVSTVLLPEVNPLVIIGAMILVCSYSVIKGIESRGRMAEVLYYVVLFPIIIILLFSFRHVDKYNIMPLFEHNQITILKTAFIIAFLFSPSELLLFGEDNFDFDKKTKRSVYYGIITVGFINLVLFAVNVGIFGVNGMLKEEWPTVTLMQVVEISGMFFERQDGIMCIFYIVSLFAIVGALINYLVLIVKKMFRVESNRRYGWIAVLFLFIASSILINADYIWKTSTQQTAKVEIEDRAYVMALGIDKLNEELSVTYAFPDLSSSSSSSGEEKEGENKNNTSQLYNCSVGNIYEAQNVYTRQSDKKLDFSHLKAIVIGVDLLEDKDYLEQIIDYFKNEPEFARSTNVCVSTEEANKIISLDSDVSGSIGDYLNKMLTKNLKGYSSSIGDLISGRDDDQTVNTLPILNIHQGFPNFIESVIVKGLNVEKYCNLEESAYYSLVSGNGEGGVLNLGEYGMYQVKSSNVNKKISIIAGKTIHLTVNLTGSLQKWDNTKDGVSEDVINDTIEENITEEITSLRREYQVDSLETQKLLGLYDKKMWKKYQDDEEGLFEHLYVEVKSEFTIR